MAMSCIFLLFSCCVPTKQYDDDGEEIPEVKYFRVDDYNFSEGNLVRKSGDWYEFRR